MKTKKIKNLVKILISILIIISIIIFIGTEKILEVISKIKIEYFLKLILFYIISTVFTTFAIKYLIKKKLYKSFKLKAVSWAAGLFFPSKIGEGSFVILLKKNGFSTKKSFAIFLVDRFVSFSIIGLLAILAIFKYIEIKIDFGHIIILIAILIVFLTNKNKIKKVSFLKKIFFTINEAKEYLKSEKRAVAINYFFSLINFILMFWVIQIIFFSIGQKISFIDIALISSLGSIIGLIPITINGLGVREGTMVYLYSLVGIEPEYSILVSFVYIISAYLLGAIFLSVYWSEFSFILKRKSEKAWLK